MDNQDKQSSWDDLARSLGADVPAEPPEGAKSTYVKISESEVRRKTAEPAPRLKPSPMSWENLAADLGLEVPPPPPAPTPVERSQPIEQADFEAAPEQLAPPRHERSGRPERHRGGERPPRRERSERGDESSESEGRPPRRSRGGRSRGDRPRGRQHSEDRPHPERERRPREEAVEEPREELREVSPPPAPEPEPAPPAAPSLGVSLWHKIFGTPDQQAERIAESTSAADVEGQIEIDSERSDWRRAPRREFDDTTIGAANEDVVDDSVDVRESWQAESVEFAADERGDMENRIDRPVDDEGGDRPRRRRRGRGRGRGRGRRSEGEQSGEDRDSAAADRTEPSDEPREFAGQREPRGRGRGGRSGRSRREDSRRREEPHDSLDDDGLEEIVLDDEQDNAELEVVGEEAGGRESAAGHKSIPSWEEAIGMIVEINLSQRGDRRRSSPSQSRGAGQSRGRSRGGRRRKKSS